MCDLFSRGCGLRGDRQEPAGLLEGQVKQLLEFPRPHTGAVVLAWLLVGSTQGSLVPCGHHVNPWQMSGEAPCRKFLETG